MNASKLLAANNDDFKGSQHSASPESCLDCMYGVKTRDMRQRPSLRCKQVQNHTTTRRSAANTGKISKRAIHFYYRSGPKQVYE